MPESNNTVPPNHQHLKSFNVGSNREAHIAYTKNPESGRITITAILHKQRNQPMTRVIRTQHKDLWAELRADLLTVI